MARLTPYLAVADARAAIEWYVAALGAEVSRQPIEMPDGRIGHCELTLEGAGWMLADAFPEAGVAAPAQDRGASVTLHLEVADVDGLAQRVAEHDVVMTRGPEDDELAGRVAQFVDPFGHRWFLNGPAAGR